MQVVILARGLGTRLKPFTNGQSKPLLPIMGKPWIDYLLELFRKDEVTLVLPEGYSMEGVRVAIQKEPLGTGDALRSAGPFDQNVLVLNGDVIARPADIKQIRKNLPAVSGWKVDDVSKYGEFVTEKGRLIDVKEKEPGKRSGLLNAGVYAFPPEIYEYLTKLKKSPRGEYELTDAVLELAKNTNVKLIEFQKYWMDMSNPWDLLEAHKIMFDNPDDWRLEFKIQGKVKPEVHIQGQVCIKPGAVIENGSVIQGPAFIDSDARIGPNACIKPYSYIGKSVVIGSLVEVSNSVIMDKTVIPQNNYISDSVIGKNCNLGAGTKITSLSSDKKLVNVKIKGNWVCSGKKNLGAFIGDGAKIGVNVSIMPGVVIDENVKIGPGTTVNHNINSGSCVYANQEKN
ncbi:MAG: NTP transferase domain-containing protein [Candidatus Altiarchaeota archaeon]|nr:NTP transferase domain-containing protein [Candidatus Altiarchaeota archaeon]